MKNLQYSEILRKSPNFVYVMILNYVWDISFKFLAFSKKKCLNFHIIVLCFKAVLKLEGPNI